MANKMDKNYSVIYSGQNHLIGFQYSQLFKANEDFWIKLVYNKNVNMN